METEDRSTYKESYEVSFWNHVKKIVEAFFVVNHYTEVDSFFKKVLEDGRYEDPQNLPIVTKLISDINQDLSTQYTFDITDRTSFISDLLDLESKLRKLRDGAKIYLNDFGSFISENEIPIYFDFRAKHMNDFFKTYLSHHVNYEG